jgi:hypothetical protein
MSAAARQHSTESDRAHNDSGVEHEAAQAQTAPDALPGGAQAQRGGNGGRNPRRSQHDANNQAAAGGEAAQGAEAAGVEGVQGEAQGEAQPAELPAPPSYQPVNPPVQAAPEEDQAAIEEAEVEKQENVALIEEQVNQAPEGEQEAAVEAPVEEVAEAPPTDPTEAAAASTDPEAAAAEAARADADAEAAELAATGPSASGAASTAGPLSASSAEEMFSAYKSAPPTQKAAAHASFAGGVGELVSAEHAAFEAQMPELHATMNGEADVEAAQAQANLGEGTMINEPGARASVEMESTPPVEAFQDNEAIVDNIFDYIMKLFANLFGGDGGRGGIFDSLRNVRVADRGANKNTGPAPAVPLEGASDTKRVADQQKQAGEQTKQAHEKASKGLDESPGPEVITPMTIDETFTVPTLNKPQVNPLPADTGVEYFLAHEFTPEHAAAFDGHYGPEMEANLAEAQGQVDAAVSDRDSGRTAAIEEARGEHERLTGEAQQAQAQEVLNNRQIVTTQRQETHRLQDEAALNVRSQLETERRVTMGAINQKVTEEQKKVDDHFAQVEIKAQAEVDKGDEKAKAERAAAEKEADEKSWWEKASDFVSSCFEALKSVINGIFDAVRAVVNTLIDAAKAFAKTIIDAACQAICGLIDAFAELAKGVVKALLSEVFPKFTESFCAFVDEKKAQAKQAVQQVAENLKAGVEALCDALKEGINAVLDAYQTAINAAIDVVKSIATGDWAELARKLIIAGAKVFGLNPDEILALLDKAGEAITLIIDNPMGFVSNVLGAMNKGFGQFGDNFIVHLKNGFVQWLTGPIPGIKVPENIFSVEGAFDLAMQVLGLTPEQLKIKAARHIGEDNVELIEQVWDHVKVLIEGGISGLWEHVKGELADMQDAVVGAIMDYVQQKVVQEAVMFIAGLFSPLPGIPKVIKVVWETYCWLRDNMQRIYAVVETVVNTMHDLATGNIQPAANGIEQALAGMVPVAIDLLAGVLGLGDLPQKLQGIIQALQARVDGAIDKAIEKFKGIFSGRKLDQGQAVTGAAEGTDPVLIDLAKSLAKRGHEAAKQASGTRAIPLRELEGVLQDVTTRDGQGHKATVSITESSDSWSVEAVVVREGQNATTREGAGSLLKNKEGHKYFTTLPDIAAFNQKTLKEAAQELLKNKSAEDGATLEDGYNDKLQQSNVVRAAYQSRVDQKLEGLQLTIDLDALTVARANGHIRAHLSITPNTAEYSVNLEANCSEDFSELEDVLFDHVIGETFPTADAAALKVIQICQRSTGRREGFPKFCKRNIQYIQNRTAHAITHQLVFTHPNTGETQEWVIKLEQSDPNCAATDQPIDASAVTTDRRNASKPHFYAAQSQWANAIEAACSASRFAPLHVTALHNQGMPRPYNAMVGPNTPAALTAQPNSTPARQDPLYQSRKVETEKSYAHQSWSLIQRVKNIQPGGIHGAKSDDFKDKHVGKQGGGSELSINQAEELTRLRINSIILPFIERELHTANRRPAGWNAEDIQAFIWHLRRAIWTEIRQDP